MPIDNQIEIPQSFMAMYVKPGHSKPNASHEVILGRYERCEDILAGSNRPELTTNGDVVDTKNTRRESDTRVKVG